MFLFLPCSCFVHGSAHLRPSGPHHATKERRAARVLPAGRARLRALRLWVQHVAVPGRHREDVAAEDDKGGRGDGAAGDRSATPPPLRVLWPDHATAAPSGRTGGETPIERQLRRGQGRESFAVLKRMLRGCTSVTYEVPN